jgi:hypothetical protein
LARANPRCTGARAVGGATGYHPARTGFQYLTSDHTDCALDQQARGIAVRRHACHPTRLAKRPDCALRCTCVSNAHSGPAKLPQANGDAGRCHAGSNLRPVGSTDRTVTSTSTPPGSIVSGKAGLTTSLHHGVPESEVGQVAYGGQIAAVGRESDGPSLSRQHRVAMAGDHIPQFHFARQMTP